MDIKLNYIKQNNMTFKEKLDSELKDAMKAKFKAGIRTIRSIKAEVTKLEKDGKPVDEIALLQKLMKQRKDSYKAFTEGDRLDLAIVEAEEMDIINIFLPSQLSDEELEEIVDTAIEDNNAETMRDMGKVIGAVKTAVQGGADGKRISIMVKSKLS